MILRFESEAIAQSQQAVAGGATVLQVILIGRYPPPVGGNTIHLERLAKFLSFEGHRVWIADPYGPLFRKGNQELRVGRGHQSELVGSPLSLFRHSAGAVVHFHISGGNRFFKYAIALLAVTASARKRVITIHSGSWVKQYLSATRANRWLMVGILNVFDDIICVNEAQKDILRPLVKKRLHVIPAYLPERLEGGGELPQAILELREACDALLVTSGYGTPTYDYFTVIKSAEMAQAETQSNLGLAIATYSSWDPDYWARVLARAKASTIPVIVTKDLTSQQFLHLLGSAKMYVRATLTDGDAVAVREAAAAGLQVLASDSVARPTGAALFRTADSRSLAARLVEALGDSNIGLITKENSLEGYQALLRIYGIGTGAPSRVL